MRKNVFSIKLAVLILPYVVALIIGYPTKAQKVATYKVIVNSANTVNSMTKTQVSNFFLKKVTKWENGHKITPVDQVETSPIREAFTKEVFNKSIAAIKSYWQQKIFSGSDVPPAELISDKAVITYIEGNIDAIGYVSTTSINSSNKVKAIELLP